MSGGVVLAAPQLSIAEGSSADPQQHMPAGLDFHGRAALVLGTAPEQRIKAGTYRRRVRIRVLLRVRTTKSSGLVFTQATKA